MKKLRLSYSLLVCWDRGDVQGAMDMYLHKDVPVSDAAKNGRRVHEELSEYINKNKSLPEWFFKYELKDPETDKVLVASYNDQFDLKGIYDCLDIPTKTLFEFKTGKSDSLEWSRTWQLPIYFLLAELNNIDIEKEIVIRNDGKESDYTVVHNSERLRVEARNIIERYGPEILNHFMNEGLL
jgi:hypothetical protein